MPATIRMGTKLHTTINPARTRVTVWRLWTIRIFSSHRSTSQSVHGGSTLRTSRGWCVCAVVSSTPSTGA